MLGLQSTDSNRFMISEDAILQLHAMDQDHPRGQAKSTAIAFLTDQLPEWYSYISGTGRSYQVHL